MADDDSCGPVGAGFNRGATRELLAEGRFAAVERCGCGAIYLHLGPLSVRLDGAALPELKEVIDRAAGRQQICHGAAFERGGRGSDRDDDGEKAEVGVREGPGGHPEGEQGPPIKLN